MPRQHIRQPGARKYADYTNEDVEKAVNAVRKGMSLRAAEAQFKIPMKTISNKVKNLHLQNYGRPTVFSEDEERQLVKLLQTCGEWGQPMDKMDLRVIAKTMLEKQGRRVPQFQNNMPGEDWATSFLKRNKEALVRRTAENIKRCRAEKTPEEINEYFDQLAVTLEGVPPTNIINYDETNLSDDPGKRVGIFKRGTKYPEVVRNFSKGATSIMFSGTASGDLLPPYVVYKSDHLWDTWCECGPQGTRYNRTKSGWFDSTCFYDWFKTIVVPYIRKLQGPKVVIGDNLSSHFNIDIINLCSEHDIRFVMLPPNSTHIAQPLDVAFFGPLK